MRRKDQRAFNEEIVRLLQRDRLQHVHEEKLELPINT